MPPKDRADVVPIRTHVEPSSAGLPVCRYQSDPDAIDKQRPWLELNISRWWWWKKFRWLCVILGSQLSYRRSTKEKFWEARREAYSAILSKLAEIDRITKGADEWMATMGQGEYLGHGIDEDKIKIREHLAAVWQRYSDDHLIMSDEFVRIFEGFISEHDKGDPNDATHSLHLHRRTIITKYRALLLAQARKELRP
jgi:hypothetical protein